MEPTTENLAFMFTGPGHEAAPFITRVLEKLRLPSTSDEFCISYFRMMKLTWEANSHPGLGWGGIQQYCIDQGIIEVLLNFTKKIYPSHERELASFYALEAIRFLISDGTGSQRHRIGQLLLHHQGLDICIEKLCNSPLIMHRDAAANLMRAFITRCPFAETLSTEQTVNLLEIFLQCIFVSTDRATSELGLERNVWQTEVLHGQILQPRVAAKYSRRWAGKISGYLMSAACGLFRRVPLARKRSILEMIEGHSNIIDLLFKCGSLPRTEEHPESHTNFFAAETLVHLMQFPLTSVPNLTIPLSDTHLKQHNEDLKISKDILRVFTSRSGWVSNLITLWAQYEDEDPEAVMKWLDRIEEDWSTIDSPKSDEIFDIMRRRGAVRLIVLRLIANASYIDTLRDMELISFLRIAYTASRKVAQPGSLSVRSTFQEVMQMTQDNYSAITSPTPDLAGDDFEPSTVLPCSEILGPIALVRLLVRIAERGLITQPQLWEQLPGGTSSSTSFEDVTKIFDPSILGKTLSTSVKRVARYREVVKNDVERDFYRHALLRYVSLAELALSVVEFDRATGGRYATYAHGARRELVFCLGNAAEMARRKGFHEEALRFAAAANHYGSEVSVEDNITVQMVEKNRRRLAAARQMLNIQ